MFVISLSSFVICHTTTNFKFDQSVFAIHDSSPHILRSVRLTTHSTPLVTHARDHLWTLYFANAFVSPVVISRAELVPSPRAYARNHGGRRRHEIRQGSNNFLSLVRNITKLSHRMEFDIPENPMFFVFRYCYILAGKWRSNFGAKKINSSYEHASKFFEEIVSKGSQNCKNIEHTTRQSEDMAIRISKKIYF
jgi:hypothetical protein